MCQSQSRIILFVGVADHDSQGKPMSDNLIRNSNQFGTNISPDIIPSPQLLKLSQYPFITLDCHVDKRIGIQSLNPFSKLLDFHFHDKT